MKWKIIILAIALVLVTVILFIVHSYNQANRDAAEELLEYQREIAPDLKTLQANARESVFENCSNDVIGLRRIVSTDFGFEDKIPTNWWARAEVEFVNTVGGIERKEVWYVFGVITNSEGGMGNVYSQKDLSRFFSDELKTSDAEYKMGLRYLNGDRVWKDISTAKDYLQKSANQGNQQAIDLLATLPQ